MNITSHHISSLRLQELPLNGNFQVAFLTGKAGTGKSFQVKRIADELRGKCLLLAPTGRAATNIGGQTIHSFFQLPFRPLNDPLTETELFERHSRKRQAMREAELIIIDEASMIRADLLDAIDCSLRKNVGKNEPFGGKPILLVGDLAQLPPVIKETPVREFIESHYESPFFFDSKVIGKTQLRVYVLDKNHRQENDVVFREVLDDVRNGGGAMLGLLNERVGGTLKSVDGRRQALVINTTNRGADGLNSSRLAQIRGEPEMFEPIIEGKFDLVDPPAPDVLLLKPGARIMFAKNGSGFSNGDLGTVEEMESEAVIVRRDSGDLLEVERARWEQFVYEFDAKTRRIREHVVGAYIQFPLRLAWAITIHRAQGLTIPHCAIDFEHRAFEHGQVYVALSRVPTLDSLALKRPIVRDDLIVNYRVRDFHAHIGMA